jgi:hypothetical protein
MIKLGKCSCRYNVDIREYAVVWSVHQDLIIEKK